MTWVVTAAGKGRAVAVRTAPYQVANAPRFARIARAATTNGAISREEIRAGIIFTRRRDRDLPIQTCHAASDIDVADVSVRVGRISVEGIDFSSFVWLLTRPVEQDEVDHTCNRVGTVNGAGAVFQDFRATQRTDADGVDVGEFKGAATIDEGQRVCRARSRAN